MTLSIQVARLRALAWAAVIAVLTTLLPTVSSTATADDFNYLVGRGIRDVTGPPLGVQMWGFVREGQTTEGVHLRLWSRAVIIAEPAAGGSRVALVTVDVGSIPHAIKQTVVERLKDTYGETYGHANVVVAATHTHAGPGGYWPEGAASPLVSAFHRTHFDKLVDGIYGSIVAAHDDLEPGAVYIAQGERGECRGATVTRGLRQQSRRRTRAIRERTPTAR